MGANCPVARMSALRPFDIDTKAGRQRQLARGRSQCGRGPGDGGLAPARSAVADEGMQQLQAGGVHAFDLVATERQRPLFVQMQLQRRLQFGEAFDAEVGLQWNLVHEGGRGRRCPTGLTACGGVT